MKKNLIIGASGLLGTYLKRYVRDYSCPNKLELDLESYLSIKYFFHNNFYENIYICAAFTNVDGCEEHKSKSFLINSKAIQYINEANKESKIIFFSTDYVFDGRLGAYDVSDMPNPINTYGRHKLCAENYLLANNENALIIRTSWLFGKDERQLNFPARIVSTLNQGSSIFASANQFGTPTYADDLAKHSVILAVNDKSGVFHISSAADIISKYNWAKLVINRFDLDPELLTQDKTVNIGNYRPLKAGLKSCIDLNINESLSKFKEEYNV